MALFRDRVDAGEKLARALGALAGQNVVVIGLPRGGVPVAAEVARALGAPLDVLIVRKLGHPRQPELAVGALAQGGFSVRNEGLMAGVSEADFARVLAREQRELERRADAYRGGRPPLDLKGKQAVLVDDGLATGATMRAAVAAAKGAGAARVIVAVPVAAREARELMESEADQVVCLAEPVGFTSVGAWYADFGQTTDAEVTALLATSAAGRAEGAED